jgi:GT2 family glycosyltransferase
MEGIPMDDTHDPDLVNIVVTTFNRISSTVRCLESIKKFTDHPYKLTVVDNGSNDETPNYLKSLKRKKVIDNLFLLKNNMGVSVACNIGINSAGTPFSLKMDNDNLIKKSDWLGRLVAKAKADESIGLVAYNVYNDNKKGEVDRCGGSILLIPGRTRTAVGNFCEEYSPYGEEDSDFSLRVKLSGLKNYYLAPDQSVEHDTSVRSYGSNELDEIRTREYRRENLYTAYFNSMLYHNNLRLLFMPTRYTPTCGEDGYIVFSEDEKYKEFLARMQPVKYAYIEKIKHAIEPYISHK